MLLKRLRETIKEFLDAHKTLSGVFVMVCKLLCKLVCLSGYGSLKSIALMSYMTFELIEETAPLVLLICLLGAASDVNRADIVSHSTIANDLVDLEQ